ncbi:MAG: VOC family protein [Clostridia bacterium]|nr:VOC family protein [Clostridia bacterium]
MKVIKTLTRLYVSDLDSALLFYENLLNVKLKLRFSYPELNLELAEAGNFLLIAGSEEALKPFQDTLATLLVDSVEEFKAHLEASGAKVLRGPRQVPTGKNMTVKHPDGSIMEYVEHSQT